MASVSVSASRTGGVSHLRGVGALCLVASALVSIVVLASGVSLSAPTNDIWLVAGVLLASIGLQRISDALVEPLPATVSPDVLARLADQAVISATLRRLALITLTMLFVAALSIHHGSLTLYAASWLVLGPSFATAYPNAWRLGALRQQLESGGARVPATALVGQRDAMLRRTR